MTEYSVKDEIVNFFKKTTTNREACDERALALVGGVGDVVALPDQGACSYTVYADPGQKFVVQFRLKSLELPLETVNLARTTHGPLVPDVSSAHGQLGENAGEGGREPVLVYLMSRVKGIGITHIDFILSYGFPENTPENFSRHKTLMTDVAR